MGVLESPRNRSGMLCFSRCLRSDFFKYFSVCVCVCTKYDEIKIALQPLKLKR